MQLLRLRSTLRSTLMLAAWFASGCATELADENVEVAQTASPLRADIRTIYNINGEPRYILHNAREVKLLFDPNKTNPKSGFANSNHFDNSCGPTAAMNVFKWYGIDKLKHCFWLEESSADVPGVKPPPIWTCVNRATPETLGRMMYTNNWKLAGITTSGTSTQNFRRVFKQYADNYLSDTHDYQYAYEEGDGLTQYRILWNILAQGNPIVVNYKTGATKGHFATIVGIEKVGNDNDLSNDKIYLANPRKEDLEDAITWGKFRELWRRDYNDFGALSAVGERRYTRINMYNKGAPSPHPGGGPGGIDPTAPPILQK